jgi:hypothetical protein
MSVRAALLLGLLAAGAGSATDAPRVVVTSRNAIAVTLPRAVLLRGDVRKQLESGLTTAFVLSMRAGAVRGAARIEVRYLLWDERYAITTVEADGREQQVILPSYAELVEWWTATAHRVAPERSVTQRSEPLVLTLAMLPFSAREEAETRRWLSRALGGPGSRQRQRETTAVRMLDAIIGTSIRRRPILEYRWTVSPENGR